MNDRSSCSPSVSASSPLAIPPRTGTIMTGISFGRSLSKVSLRSNVLLNVPTDAVRDVRGREGTSLELALDLRRLLPLNTLLIRFAVVLDPEDLILSLSLLLDELEELDEVEEPSISAKTPG